MDLTMTSPDFFSVRQGKSRAPRPITRRGFSILELVITLVLVGIVALISGGRITAMRDQQRVTRAAGSIQVQLEKSFAIAGRDRQPVEISWNATTLTLAITNRSGTITYGSAYLGNSNYGLKTGEVTATATNVEVYPNGLASGTLSITINTVRGTRTYRKVVSMTRAGMVKVT
jgi:prepilin-type N-terminal cleavage/methylation domain-containing protein